jgi:hypothetical protein
LDEDVAQLICNGSKEAPKEKLFVEGSHEKFVVKHDNQNNQIRDENNAESDSNGVKADSLRSQVLDQETVESEGDWGDEAAKDCCPDWDTSC